MLSPLARLLFPPTDDTQLTHLYEDNLRIEPEWYCPILPLVLVNGSDGIGTGYSTTVPNFNPREILANIKRMLAGQEPVDMVCRGYCNKHHDSTVYIFNGYIVFFLCMKTWPLQK